MSALSASATVPAPLREAVPGVAPGAGNAGLCYHCGATNPRRGRWHEVVNGAPRDFCCAGCLAVAQTIDAAGLAGFYANRVEAPLTPGAVDADEWTRWDDAAAMAGLVRDLDPERREAALLLEGVTCGACVWLIESWLARQPGVREVSVNLANRRARVVWDPGRTRFSSVLRAVAAIGYRAYPYDPARREALARRERRALLLRMAVAVLATMQVMMFALPAYVTSEGVAPAQQRLLDWAGFVLTLPALAYSAAPFFHGAWRGIQRRRPGMDVPVALGIAAAFAASTFATFTGRGTVYYDSVTMFIALLLVARYLELVARQKAGAAIEDVARARPAVAERAGRWPASAATETVAAAALAPGDVVLVRPGAVVPADGEVLEGRSHVDEAMLTGESLPALRAPGDAVLAGGVNRDSPLIVSVRAAGEATRLAAVLRLVERTACERPAVARLADRVAGWFVAALLLLALATVVVWWQIDPARALPVTVALLVVSCPCALSLATPAALAAAAGSLARAQVVFARSDALETLGRVTHVVLDKTGTLTEGRLRLAACETAGTITREDALALAAALEARSEHPLAAALAEAGPAPGAGPVVQDLRQTPGDGVEGTMGGVRTRVGRPEFVAALSGPMPAALRAFCDRAADAGALVALGDEVEWHAVFGFSDTLRAGTPRLIAELRDLGITPVLLSGDRMASVARVAQALSIADARGDLRPEDKRDAIAALQAAGAVVAMMGDGINDAPALAQAQVSISLGTATPLAQHTADVVILSDRVEEAATALRVARRTLSVIRQNLAWATVYNAVAIPAAAFGFVTPLVAAAGMSASSLVVVVNALRLVRVRRRGVPLGALRSAPDLAPA
jgi:Cu2+-exporting ATPase